ncbi:hypothetical protein LTS17_011657 [Exophiala oligosperma]
MSSSGKRPCDPAVVDVKTTNSEAEFVKRQITAPPGLPSKQPSTSAWQEPPGPIAQIQSQHLPDAVDIVIIGSGLTGCGVAHTLLNHPAAARLHITVLEARNAVSGATGRNGGHLVSNAAELVPGLVADFGPEEAAKVARFSEAAIIRLKEIVDGLDKADHEASEFRHVVSTMGFHDQETFESSKRAIELLQKIAPSTGVLNHNIISAEEAIEKYRYRDVVGGAEQHGAAALWPYRMLTAVYKDLLNRYQGRFTLETNTPALSIESGVPISDGDSLYIIETPRGQIRSRKVIHCTNGYAGHLIPKLRGSLYPLRGTMSVQKPSASFPRLGDQVSWAHGGQRNLDPRTGIMDASLYYAQQNAVTGEVWIGGDVQPLSQLLTSDDSCVGELAARNLSTILPRIFDDDGSPEPLKVWSGIMAFTADGLPIVGKLLSSLTERSGDGEWISAGYNGHGMDKGWLCGEAVARMVLEEETPELPGCYLLSAERLKSLTVDNAVDRLLNVIEK